MKGQNSIRLLILDSMERCLALERFFDTHPTLPPNFEFHSVNSFAAAVQRLAAESFAGMITSLAPAGRLTADQLVLLQAAAREVPIFIMTPPDEIAGCGAVQGNADALHLATATSGAELENFLTGLYLARDPGSSTVDDTHRGREPRNSRLGMLLIDRSGRIVQLNSVGAQLLRADFRTLRGRHFASLLSPRRLPLFLRRWGKHIDGTLERSRGEFWIDLRTGGRRLIQLDATTIRVGQASRELSVLFRDVSAQRAAEARLARKEQMRALESALDRLTRSPEPEPATPGIPIRYKHRFSPFASGDSWSGGEHSPISSVEYATEAPSHSYGTPRPHRVGGATIGVREQSAFPLWSTFRLAPRKIPARDAPGPDTELRALTAGLWRAREAERARISREIHDELGQALTGLRFELSRLGSALRPDHRELASQVRAMEGSLDQTIGSMQRLVSELRPRVLDDFGLIPALESLVRQFSTSCAIGVECEFPAEPLNLSRERELHLYRIVQEALTNVGRHARAESVRVAFRTEGGHLVLEIDDDGVGLRRSARGGGRIGVGVIGMKERAHEIDASFSIDSPDDRGTRVRLQMPIG